MEAACANLERVLLAAMTVLVFFQVITRYFFSYTLAWVEELTIYLMIWMAYLGSAALFKDNDHIRLNLVINKFSKKARVYLYLLLEVIQIAFLIMLFKLGLDYIESVEIVTSTTLRISMRWPVMIISISALLMIFFILSHAINTIMSLIGLTSTGD